MKTKELITLPPAQPKNLLSLRTSRSSYRASAGLTVGELLLIVLVAGVAVGGTVLAFLGFSSPPAEQQAAPALTQQEEQSQP